SGGAQSVEERERRREGERGREREEGKGRERGGERETGEGRERGGEREKQGNLLIYRYNACIGFLYNSTDLAPFLMSFVCCRKAEFIVQCMSKVFEAVHCFNGFMSESF